MSFDTRNHKKLKRDSNESTPSSGCDSVERPGLENEDMFLHEQEHVDKKKRLLQDSVESDEDVPSIQYQSSQVADEYGPEESAEGDRDMDSSASAAGDDNDIFLSFMGTDIMDMMPVQVLKFDWWNKGKQSKEKLDCYMQSERLALLYCLKLAILNDPRFQHFFPDVTEAYELIYLETPRLRGMLELYNRAIEGDPNGVLRRICPATHLPFHSPKSLLAFLAK
ncbi:hypothetical protein HDV03_003556 [Kappamyces sp. JEL0829]|nr:hypothetical protein HDV03_003556 [Kappamyces sp. JEL0829]